MSLSTLAWVLMTEQTADTGDGGNGTRERTHEGTAGRRWRERGAHAFANGGIDPDSGDLRPSPSGGVERGGRQTRSGRARRGETEQRVVVVGCERRVGDLYARWLETDHEHYHGVVRRDYELTRQADTAVAE